jgi:hypothetical protein
MDPVPISLARALAPGLPVVAVVLSPPVDQWQNPVKPRLLSTLPFLGSYISRHRFTRALDIFMRSVDIGGALLTEQILELERPEVIIRPAVPHIGLMDPSMSQKWLALGSVRRRLLCQSSSAWLAGGGVCRTASLAGAILDPITGWSMGRDLRRYARQTNVRLGIGGILLLLVVGDGLIYLIYGRGAALMGLLCLLLGLAPLALIWLALTGLDWVVKKAGRQ